MEASVISDLSIFKVWTHPSLEMWTLSELSITLFSLVHLASWSGLFTSQVKVNGWFSMTSVSLRGTVNLSGISAIYKSGIGIELLRAMLSKQLKTTLFGWLVGFLTSSSTTRLYRVRAPRQSLWQFNVLPHMRQSWETMTSVSASHYTDTDPTSRERAATAGIEPGTSSTGVVRSTDWATTPPRSKQWTACNLNASSLKYNATHEMFW